MASFDGIRFQPSRPLLKELSADRLNAILAEIRKNRPRGEKGITVRQTGDGTLIGLAANTSRGSESSASQPKPWDIYVSETEGEGEDLTYTLKVRPGTIARVLPSNWNDSFPNIANDDLYYGIVEIETDGTYITDVEIAVKNTPPVFQNAVKFGLSDYIEIPFGLFFNGAAYNLTEGGNIGVSAVNVLTAALSPPVEPGAPMFELYFRLQ